MNLSLTENKDFHLLRLSQDETCQDTFYIPFIINKNTHKTLQKEDWFICPSKKIIKKSLSKTLSP